MQTPSNASTADQTAMRAVHSAGSAGSTHESQPANGGVAAAVPVLEVACRLSPPWAFLAGGRLVGLDVLTLQRYAELTGHAIHWQVCDAEGLLERIRSGQAVLGIGGLPESLARRGGGPPLLASSRRLAATASDSFPRERHMWATGRLPAAELWRLRAYLLWKRLRGFGRK